MRKVPRTLGVKVEVAVQRSTHCCQSAWTPSTRISYQIPFYVVE